MKRELKWREYSPEEKKIVYRKSNDIDMILCVLQNRIENAESILDKISPISNPKYLWERLVKYEQKWGGIGVNKKGEL
jgi:hypothetical protein